MADLDRDERAAAAQLAPMDADAERAISDSLEALLVRLDNTDPYLTTGA
jgi:hypothetical protein